MEVTSGKKKGPSVDAYAAQISLLCTMNQVCVMWQSILDQKLEVSSDVAQKLAVLIEKALSLKTDVVDKPLHYYCARSIGFLHINVHIALIILQGKY